MSSISLSSAPSRKDEAGPQQSVDGTRGRTPQNGCAVRRLHEGAHAVRGAVLHGTDRFAVLTLRRGNHRQRLRRAQHEIDDAHGPGRARAHYARRHVRQGAALYRRPQSRIAALSCTFPKNCRSRASARVTAAMRSSARSVMHCALPAGRPAPRVGWRNTCSSLGSENPQGEVHYLACAFPVRLRQDQPSHVDSARKLQGLESVDRRRRHCMDAPGQGRPACTPSTRNRATSVSFRARTPRPIATPTKPSARTRFSPTSRSPPITSRGGKVCPRASRSPIGRAARTTLPTAPAAPAELTIHCRRQAKPCLFETGGTRPGAFPFPPSFSAAGAAPWRRSCTRRTAGPHGVLIGAGVASETTAAATSAVGVLRRDPMAMKPFAGYNFGDYWAHWIDVRCKTQVAAADLSRQLVPSGRCRQIPVARLRRPICASCAGSSIAAKGTAGARDTAIGYLPQTKDMDIAGLDLAPNALEELLTVDAELWDTEFEGIREYFRGLRRSHPSGPRVGTH